MNTLTHIDEHIVRDLLTAADIDPGQRLQITARKVRSRVVDFDYTGPWRLMTEVEIRGPAELRWQAYWHLLYEAGLACAPTPDVDIYTAGREADR